MSAVLELAKTLIARPSVTPQDAGCQTVIVEKLQHAGFRCEAMRFGEIDNLWAAHGDNGPLLVFAGHTDVVPPGPREKWHEDPFSHRIFAADRAGCRTPDRTGGLPDGHPTLGKNMDRPTEGGLSGRNAACCAIRQPDVDRFG